MVIANSTILKAANAEFRHGNQEMRDRALVEPIDEVRGHTSRDQRKASALERLIGAHRPDQEAHDNHAGRPRQTASADPQNVAQQAKPDAGEPNVKFKNGVNSITRADPSRRLKMSCFVLSSAKVASANAERHRHVLASRGKARAVCSLFDVMSSQPHRKTGRILRRPPGSGRSSKTCSPPSRRSPHWLQNVPRACYRSGTLGRRPPALLARAHAMLLRCRPLTDFFTPWVCPSSAILYSLI